MKLLSLAALCSFLFACGGADRDDGTVELELWTLALRPRFTDYVEDVIARFESAHPGVTVDWVDVPFDTLNRKLIAAAAAGTAPDVVNFSDLQYARFASLGATGDMAASLDIDPDAVYLPGVLAPARIDGQLGALPWYLSTPVALVNTGLLAEADWEVDDLGRDWPALMQQARRYREATGRFLFSQSLAVESELPVMLIANGTPPFAERDGRLRADLTRPAVADYVRGWVELYRDGVLPREAATAGHAHIVELYQNGRVALAVTGANFLSRVADSAPDVFDATAVRSAPTGALGRAHVAVMFVGVTSTTAHPRESAALAAWLTNAENQLALGKLVNILPSTPASLEDPHFNTEMLSNENEDERLTQARVLSAASLQDAVAFTPALGVWPDLRRAFEEGIKPALLDDRDVNDALLDIEAEWNRILNADIPATMDAIPRPAPAERVQHAEGVTP